MQRLLAEIAAKDRVPWRRRIDGPIVQDEIGERLMIVRDGWWSNESVCYSYHRLSCVVLTITLQEFDSLLFVPAVDVGILQQRTALTIFALLAAFHQQRNLLEFLKKRETKHAKTECRDPFANIAKHMDAVAWVRGLPVCHHVGRLLSKLSVGEYFRQEEN